MTPKRKGRSEQEVFADLAHLSDEASRKRYLARHRRVHRPDFVEKLSEEIHRLVRADVQQAAALAEAAELIARELNSKEALAVSVRAKGNVAYARGQHKAALDFYHEAISLFETLQKPSEVGRTLSASIQPHILLGEYDQAFAVAEQARDVFTKLGDTLRLARLDINVGNILHRRDRFDEALTVYERSYQQLLPFDDSEGIAAVLSNIALCLIMLNDFSRALETYQRARGHCEQHGMHMLVAQADYNIAYLYYLRGEYSRAIEMLRDTREVCKKFGDQYHSALCDLDQSEMYLELSLSSEAAELAEAAYASFQRLGMGYEAAKALTNTAIACSQQGKSFRALELFAQAKAKFVQEKNQVWPSLLDLYQALVLYEEGRMFEARRLCLAALEFFRNSTLPTKAVLCHLLLARLALRSGDIAGAEREFSNALAKLAGLEAPILSYQAHFLKGQVLEAGKKLKEAFESYQEARRFLETLRSGLRGEELKIAFMKNKVEVYERLFELTLRSGEGTERAEQAFGYVEQSKSRSLVELILRRAPPTPTDASGRSGLAKHVHTLREELNWYYHRIDLEQLSQQEQSAQRVAQLQEQILAREKELLHALRQLPPSDAEFASLYLPASLPLEAIRAALPPDTTLLEYFFANERIFVCLLTQNSLEVIPVTLVSRVNNILHMLLFQLAKFRLGSEYIGTFHQSLLETAQTHLQELHEELIAPIADRLQGSHVIVVPHAILHQVPFHALYDGERYLIDKFSISFAPSASIYALCHAKPANSSGPALVLGVPDPQAPFILEEVQSVASMLADTQLFLGANANEEVLREKGPQSRLVHIATHGYFRQDNPMFSAIRLGTSYLNLYDFYHLRLPVELVTLSGCATGLSVVVAGDELLGLMRGLLYAGAQSLLLTLWDVQDQSTAEFMRLFYLHLKDGGDKVTSLRKAMLGLREHYPHPYYWAPFLLVGKISSYFWAPFAPFPQASPSK